MELKNIEKIFSIITSINCFKYPMKNQIEGNPLSKSWPVPPIYNLAELKGEEINEWRGRFEAKHKQKAKGLDGLVKYTEVAKVGGENIEVELEYHSILEKYVKLPTIMGVVDAILPLSPYTLQEFVDMLYANTNLPPLKSESANEIEARIYVRNEYDPHAPVYSLKWCMARYYPELHIKLDDKKLILKYSAVWNPSIQTSKLEFYPQRKVLIEYGNFQTETDDKDICKIALEILSSYTIVKSDKILQKRMSLKVNGNEIAINEYVDKIAFEKLAEICRGVSEETDYIQSQFELLKPKVDSKYREIISLLNEKKLAQSKFEMASSKSEKDKIEKELLNLQKRIEAATYVEEMEPLDNLRYYSNILLSLKNNEKSFGLLGCKEANRKYSEILNLIPKKLLQDAEEESRKIIEVEQLLSTEGMELEKYSVKSKPPAYIV
jgi:hypothetical protein